MTDELLTFHHLSNMTDALLEIRIEATYARFRIFPEEEVLIDSLIRRAENAKKDARIRLEEGEQ